MRGESALAIGWMGAAARSAVPFLARLVRGPEASLIRTPAPRSRTPTAIRPPASDALTPPQLPEPDESPASVDVNCRVYAAQALGRIGAAASAALGDLRDAAATGPESVRAAAQQAIRQIQGT